MKKKPKQSRIDKAFLGSDKHVLGDLKLKPLTASRYVCAQGMGMVYPQIGPEGWDQFNRTKMYPGLVKDITILLFVCTLTDSEVEDADCAPKDAYRRAKTWADGKGILKPDSHAFWEAYSMFSGIVREMNESATVPKGTEEEEDEPGNE